MERSTIIPAPSWVIILLVIGAPFLGWFVQIWLKAFIEKRVQFGIDRQLETIRSEIRLSEERLKSELRTREAEIALLREGVMSGRSSRIALVEKRRVEAVDRLWRAFTRLTRMKGPAMSLSTLRVDAIAKSVPTDPKTREFVQILTKAMEGTDFEERMTEIRADEERPFVSEMTWALYSAYTAVILGGWAVLKILSIGAENSDKLINRGHVDGLLKVALPHQSNYIDTHGEASHYHLLEEIEQNLIAELKRSLLGEESDADNVKRSSAIMKEVAKVTSDTERISAAAVT